MKYFFTPLPDSYGFKLTLYDGVFSSSQLTMLHEQSFLGIFLCGTNIEAETCDPHSGGWATYILGVDKF